MGHKRMVTGELLGYSERYNFFSANIYVLVKVNNRIVKIPIDHRQKKFIQKEFPIGSEVELAFDRRWSIKSKPAPEEFDLDGMITRVF